MSGYVNMAFLPIRVIFRFLLHPRVDRHASSSAIGRKALSTQLSFGPQNYLY